MFPPVVIDVLALAEQVADVADAERAVVILALGDRSQLVLVLFVGTAQAIVQPVDDRQTVRFKQREELAHLRKPDASRDGLQPVRRERRKLRDESGGIQQLRELAVHQRQRQSRIGTGKFCDQGQPQRMVTRIQGVIAEQTGDVEQHVELAHPPDPRVHIQQQVRCQRHLGCSDRNAEHRPPMFGQGPGGRGQTFEQLAPARPVHGIDTVDPQRMVSAPGTGSMA